MSGMNVFVYGTLMFAEVRAALIKDRYHKVEARLEGFKRLEVKGQVYPGMIEAQASFVDGMLILGVQDTDMLLLDRFEGEYYRRAQVAVSANDGRLVDAETYIFRERYRYLLGDAEWDIDRFCNNGIKAFLAEYGGFLEAHNR
jgi:gamma-glutamylcyclotransferase (GGCT)/AIG2-like uncharacterized protein YtfP